MDLAVPCECHEPGRGLCSSRGPILTAQGAGAGHQQEQPHALGGHPPLPQGQMSFGTVYQKDLRALATVPWKLLGSLRPAI